MDQTAIISHADAYRAGFQTIYFNNYNIVNWIELRLNSKVSASESLAKVQEVFKKYVPDVPFDYKFADQEYAQKFTTKERIGKLSGIFALLAILISCLGLSGFVRSREAHERAWYTESCWGFCLQALADVSQRFCPIGDHLLRYCHSCCVLVQGKVVAKL